MRRPKCLAPKEHSRKDPVTPNVIKCCPESPVIGNMSQAPKRYCSTHSYLEQLLITDYVKKPSPTVPPMKLRRTGESAYEVVDRVPPITIRLPEFEGLFPQIISGLNLYDEDFSDRGYKKRKNVNKFYETTAGTIAAVKPYSIIVNCQELFTSESPTQAFLFLINTFMKESTVKISLKYCGYDRSCDLHPFYKK